MVVEFLTGEEEMRAFAELLRPEPTADGFESEERLVICGVSWERYLFGRIGRWEACRAETPEDEEVLYPPLPLSAEELMRLAISADRVERRRANKVQEDK
jgi:hypothetical protein